MEQIINANKIKVASFSAELPKELDANLRTFVTAECEIYETALRDNNDETFDRIFKMKLVGSTVVKQTNQKDTYICKSKRSPSTRLRARVWSDTPDGAFYELMIDKLIFNWDEVKTFLLNK